MTDKLIRAIDKNGHFRAFVLDSTETVRSAQTKHDTWASSTVALGRTLIAAQILAANQKGDDKVTLRILGQGKFDPIVAVANTLGDVKGYIKFPQADYKRNSTGQVLVGELIGAGWFVVVKDFGLKTPYTGQTPLVSGEIGEDLAYYLTTSEQTPSAVGINVLLDDQDKVKSAGGFMVQVMPGATDSEITTFEQNIQNMPAISEILETPDPLSNLLNAIFGQDHYKILDESPLAFKCDCSKTRFSNGIASLGNQSLDEMIADGKGADVVCQFCQTPYHFTTSELLELKS